MSGAIPNNDEVVVFQEGNAGATFIDNIRCMSCYSVIINLLDKISLFYYHYDTKKNKMACK